jgi:hypothetical protein
MNPKGKNFNMKESTCPAMKRETRLATINTRLIQAALIGLIGAMFSTAGFAAPLGTAFTYSGRLRYQNQPANGNFDLQIKLFDAASAGNQVGLTLNVNSLAFVNGLFFTSLDFGAGVFDGTAYWLEIAARPSGNGQYTILSPRQPVNPAPYSLFAPTAATAEAVALNSVGTVNIQNNSVTAPKIAAGQVVKSLDGLSDDVTLAAGANVTLTRNGNTLTIDSTAGGTSWSLTGNSGTTPGQNFLGTLDNQPLELRVNNVRGLHLENVGSFIRGYSMNWIAGHSVNRVDNGAIGATIAGGGLFNPNLGGDSPNVVGADFGSIGGGGFNTVGGQYGTVPGGFGNEANGAGSFAAGELASVTHDGSFLWSDGNQHAYSSGPSRFEVVAAGGMSLTSPRGISLNAADRPIITRGWDPFDQTSPAEKVGLGRWGLFMEFTQLVLGMPDVDVPGGERTIAFGRYRKDGTYDELMSIRNTDGRASFAGDFLTVNGSGGELAYLGGDGVGGDVQLGSLNPNIQTVALYNATQGQYMDLYVRTLTILGGADLAEPFQLSSKTQQASQGTVVVIDEENPGQLRMSDRAYDKRVAGILSGAGGVEPGIRLRQKGVIEGSQNVALTGRVYALADASNGPIKPGDLLTTSDTPGHAMKVTDQSRAQGAILGKAMSGLEQGKGLVLVLVTLQ